MNLNYAAIPASARTSVEALGIWCLEQLASRNGATMIREREQTVADSGLEYAASVSRFKSPEGGQALIVGRMTLKLPADHALSKSWDVAIQISTGDPAPAGYYQ